MKNLRNAVVRSVFAILVGLIFIVWPELTMNYFVMAIGLCFILPGAFALFGFFARKKNEGEPDPMFPLEGAGSIFFGLLLFIFPHFFAGIFMYVLGAVLLVAGLQQIIWLILARKWCNVPYGFYLLPILIFVTGLMILIYPFEAALNTFVLFGVTMLLYGLYELLLRFKFRWKEVKEGIPADHVDHVDTPEAISEGS